MKSKGWIAALFLLGIVMAGWAAETPPTVAVLDFSIPAAESNRWAWAEGGVSDLLQIELQQQGLLLLDCDGIHAVLVQSGTQIDIGSLKLSEQRPPQPFETI